jgi:hypothetical protein
MHECIPTEETEFSDRVETTIASYSGSLCFKSRPGDRPDCYLSWFSSESVQEYSGLFLPYIRPRAVSSTDFHPIIHLSSYHLIGYHILGALIQRLKSMETAFDSSP